MGSRSMYHVATGGVRLKVPDTMAHEARIILSQTWSVTAAQLGIDDDYDNEVGDQHLTEETLASPGDSSSLSYSLIFFLAVGLPSLLLAYLLIRHLY